MVGVLVGVVVLRVEVVLIGEVMLVRYEVVVNLLGGILKVCKLTGIYLG